MIIMEEYEAAMEVTAKLELKEALENRRRQDIDIIIEGVYDRISPHGEGG